VTRDREQEIEVRLRELALEPPSVEVHRELVILARELYDAARRRRSIIEQVRLETEKLG
jgi:hypothetical protein